MIIALIIFFGLAFITLAVLARYNIKLAAVLIVPLSYAGYYLIANEVPRYFGYAVALNFTDLDQSRYISGYESDTSINILVIEKGSKEPRLVSIPKTPENMKEFQIIQAQSKQGVAILKKASKNKKLGNGDSGPQSDIESVPMKDQEILTK